MPGTDNVLKCFVYVTVTFWIIPSAPFPREDKPLAQVMGTQPQGWDSELERIPLYVK